jgi:hypothetical protein
MPPRERGIARGHIEGLSMSHTIRLNGVLGVIVLRFRACVDFSEIRKVFDGLVLIPGFKAGLSLVADFRDNSPPLTGAETARFADCVGRTEADWGATKWVFIAAKDTSFGLARSFSLLTSNYNIQTKAFRNASEADDWLGLGTDVEDILALTPE